jgi:2-keto-4-pentenoate hydratase/2-oxohepta-3-ene-1,7-dioic acid hydratase in catechol pathway
MKVARALIGESSCLGEVIDDSFAVITGDIFGDHRRTDESYSLSEITLGTPLEGGRFVNIMGGFNPPGTTTRAPDRLPMWLPKATNFPSGDGGEIQIPAVLTGPVVMEAELAVVVGRLLRKASPQQSHDAIFGWTVFNDITASEYGNAPLVGNLWALGKSIDGFSSWGPWIRTDLTEADVMNGLSITGRINGREVQSGNTKNYCFTPSEMLSHISHRITLFPGDVVTLGTPPLPTEVTIDDHVECEVENVGVLNNYMVAETVELPSSRPRRRSPAT